MEKGFRVFYQNVFQHMKTTGSIAPSSAYLAAAMVKGIESKGQPLRILEAGPGTGPFTVALGQLLNEGDQLDLCELNDGFVKHLKSLVDTHPALKPKKPQISIMHKAVQEIEGKQCYDYIVSGLPFNNFDDALVQSVLDVYRRLIKPGGQLTFFEYAWVKPVNRMIRNRTDWERIRKVGIVVDAFLETCMEEKRFVGLNIPPSVVYVCRF